MSLENVQVSFDKSKDFQVKVNVNVPAAEIIMLREKIAKEFQKEVILSGFRKGKAPLAMIEKSHKSAIDSETQERAIKLSFGNVMNQKDFTPMGYPQFDEKIENNENGLSFTVIFDIEPEIDLGDYKTIRIAKEDVKVEEKDIKEAIENIRNRQKRIEKSDTAESKIGDMLKISYNGIVDVELGEDAKRLVKAEESWMLLDEPEMIPGIKTFLIGKKSGEKITTDVEFPVDFYVADLAGKKINYTFDILEVHTGILPEVNDEFAEKVGFKTVAELKKMIEENMLGAKEREAAAKVQDLAVKELAKMAGKFKVSSAQVNAEAESLKKSPEMKEKSDTEIRETAEERVRLFYILSKLARVEDIAISRADFENHIKMMAYYSKKDPKTLEKEIVKDGRVDALVLELKLDKAVQKLGEIALSASN